MSYTSVIRFQVRPGMEQAFEAAFLKAGMLERPSVINGFVSAKLVRGIGEPNAYFVIGEWLTEQSYADWQAVSSSQADPAAVAAMRETLVDHAPGRLFAMVASSAD